MSAAEPAGSTEPAGSSRRTRIRTLWRYGAGSVIATVCSEVVFLTLYGVLGTSTTWASILGWLAGAVPSYWLNRTWTWGRRGRPSLRGELLPYVAIVLATLTLAVSATSAADAALTATDLDVTTRSALVGAVFLLVYVLVFVLRFFLLDRLFKRASQPTAETTDALSEKDAR